MHVMFRAAAAAIAFAATPGLAQDARPAFNGGHIEAITGYDNVHGGGETRDGLLYGVGLGYDLRLHNAVVGIEGEASDSTTAACDGTVCVKAGRDLYVGGRIGAVVGSVLLYGKFGYTNGRIVVTAGGVSAGTNLDGVRAGAGVEWALPGTPVSLRAEYRYSNYQDDIERHQVAGGIALRF